LPSANPSERLARLGGRWKIKARKTNASFIEPMLLLRSETLPEGEEWIYELKLDGYRALAIKSGGRVQLRSRNDNDFTSKYPAIAKALERLPDESVLDGEVVAFDESGRPSFNTLQNRSASAAPVFYYVFDVLVFAGRNLTGEPLDVRRGLLQTKVLPRLAERYGTRRSCGEAFTTFSMRSAPMGSRG
jgi:bifunctional non-homologous end joining protein LigD